MGDMEPVESIVVRHCDDYQHHPGDWLTVMYTMEGEATHHRIASLRSDLDHTAYICEMAEQGSNWELLQEWLHIKNIKQKKLQCVHKDISDDL